MTEWADEIATLANQRTFGLLVKTFYVGIFNTHLVLSKWHENLSLFFKMNRFHFREEEILVLSDRDDFLTLVVRFSTISPFLIMAI